MKYIKTSALTEQFPIDAEKTLSEILAREIDKAMGERLITWIEEINIEELKKLFPGKSIEWIKEELKIKDEHLKSVNVKAVYRDYKLKRLIN